MKKFFLFLSAIGMIVASCQSDNPDADGNGNNGELPTPPQTEVTTKIASIEEQSTNITATIATLEKTKVAINTTIASLKEQQPTVRGNDNDNNGVKDMISDLEERVETLELMIENLKGYTQGYLAASRDWMEATFATMEQYNELASELATLKATIDNLDMVSTTELAEALTASEESMKQWVNEQLAGYYTIAEVDAQIVALKEALADGDEAMRAEVDALVVSVL